MEAPPKVFTIGATACGDELVLNYGANADPSVLFYNHEMEGRKGGPYSVMARNFSEFLERTDAGFDQMLTDEEVSYFTKVDTPKRRLK